MARQKVDQIKALAKSAAAADPAARRQADQDAQAALDAVRAVGGAGGDLGAVGVSLVV